MNIDSQQAIEKFQELSQSKSFLGQEFLTWLWYTVEAKRGEFTLAGLPSRDKQVEIWIDNKITLESSQSMANKHLLRGGQPGSSPEATTALRCGKYVTEIAIGLAHDELECSFVLNSKDLNPKALGFPNIKPSPEHETIDLITSRIRAIETVTDVLDQLFLQFIDARTDQDWETKGLDDIRGWIDHRNHEDRKYHLFFKSKTVVRKKRLRYFYSLTT